MNILKTNCSDFISTKCIDLAVIMSLEADAVLMFYFTDTHQVWSSLQITDLGTSLFIFHLRL